MLIAPRHADPVSSCIELAQARRNLSEVPTLVFVVAQHTVFEHKPTQLIAARVVGPLLQIALHFTRLVGAHATVSRSGSWWSAGEDCLFLNTSLGCSRSWRSFQDGTRPIVLCIILGQLPLSIATERICPV